MTQTAIKYHPKVNNYETSLVTRIGVKEADEIWKQKNEDEKKAWDVCDILQERVIRDCIRDPLSDVKCVKAANSLSVE